MFSYCPQCGYIKKSNQSNICPVCDYKLENVPSEYLTKDGNLFKSQNDRQLFIQDIIMKSNIYNAELSQNKENILSEKEILHKENISQKIEEYKANKKSLKCPVCQSCNLSTISNLMKVAKVSAFGILGAGEIGKNWKCNSCGYKF